MVDAMNRLVIIFDSALPVVFDGTLAQTFVVDLHNTVIKSRAKNIAPGVLYTVVVHQDDIGYHNFYWPDNCRNAASVDPAPGSTTTQNFIGTPGGFLDANAAMSYAEVL